MKPDKDAELEAFTPVPPKGTDQSSARSYRKVGEHEILPHGRAESIKETVTGAAVLARHVFAPKAGGLPLVDYAVQYRLTDGFAGGDIADVYEFDNGSVAFMAADVEGRGVQAAALATLIKFSLRAFASAGMTAEATMLNLDRVYLENCVYENIDSFASVFFAHVDSERRTMGYSSAGHEPAILMRPEEAPVLLPVTAPLIGLSMDRQYFNQRYMEIVHGTVLVLATDGVTEARNGSGELYGNERLLECVERGRGGSMSSLAKAIIDDALHFSGGTTADDIAVLAARFH